MVTKLHVFRTLTHGKFFFLFFISILLVKISRLFFYSFDRAKH